MNYRILGKTGLKVSTLSFGASSLGGVFGAVDEHEAIKAVHTALDLGINFFDVAPAYGGTRSETVLGRALKGIPRDRYFLSTKVGKYTLPGTYGADTFDYSPARTLSSIQESAQRLGTDYFDVLHIHDIEYQGRAKTESALNGGLEAVQQLKREGRIGAVGFGIYPMDLWHRILKDHDIDAALIHNHYCLNDTRLLELLPLAKQKDIGVINASPFACGLLTDQGPPDWHPVNAADKPLYREVADFCRQQGTSISKLALQFSTQNPDIPTTLFSTASQETVRRNVQWHEEPCDLALLSKVRALLKPVLNKQWEY